MIGIVIPPLRHCEERSDEAIHLTFLLGQMDCFASLAMTGRALPGADQRQRFIALEQIEQAAQCVAALAG
jgi:hypothetical protein